jgi:glycosyltransferase involved in cell wall biosynthesis
MISVITLTYRRYQFLEEAIHSFLLQDFDCESEMVIVNDCPSVTYEIDNDRIRVINLNTRFSSIGKKLEYGMKQCKYDYVYRLDDDDLLTPWAFSTVANSILQSDKHDIYRCKKHYLFDNNKYEGMGGSVNNGNCYTKEYINRAEFPDISIGEDSFITFDQGAKIYTNENGYYSMIYRWGMNTAHISGFGDLDSSSIFKAIDRNTTEEGHIVLRPHFNQDYYSQLPT